MPTRVHPRRRARPGALWAAVLASLAAACHNLPGLSAPPDASALSTDASVDALAGSGSGTGAGDGTGTTASSPSEQETQVPLTVSGLVNSLTLVVDNLQQVSISPPAPTVLTVGAGPNFTIGVQTQPRGQTCEVTPAAGSVQAASKGGVAITCQTALQLHNNHAASHVIGQQNLTANASPSPPTAGSLNAPSGKVAASPGWLWVSDSGNNRLLGFQLPLPAAAGPAAGLVWGSAATGSPPMVTGQSLDLPVSVAYDSNSDRLAVPDFTDNRVLIFQPPPTQPGQSPNMALGQGGSFNSSQNACTRSGLSGPSSAIAAAGALVVTDLWNNRLLIWGQIPSLGSAPADIVWGAQPPGSFTACTGQTSAAQPCNLSMPKEAYWDGQWLYVADQNYNRVLVWDGVPGSATTPPTFVLGELNLYDQPGGNADYRLTQPQSVVADSNTIWVADTFNHRVVAYSRSEVESTRSVGGGNSRQIRALYVIGQATIDSDNEQNPNSPNQGSTPGPNTLNQPSGVAIVGTQLVVTDQGNNRILFFDSD